MGAYKYDLIFTQLIVTLIQERSPRLTSHEMLQKASTDEYILLLLE